MIGQSASVYKHWMKRRRCCLHMVFESLLTMWMCSLLQKNFESLLSKRNFEINFQCDRGLTPPLDEDRTTAIGNLHKRNLVKFDRVVFELNEPRDKQTNRHTDHNTSHPSWRRSNVNALWAAEIIAAHSVDFLSSHILAWAMQTM